MRYLPFFFFALILSSCSFFDRSIPETFDYGKAENGIYQNEFFDMEVPYNIDWSVQSTEQMNQLVEAGSAMFDDDQVLKAAVEASKVNTAYLFSIFKHEMGSAVTFNPSFLSLAENVKNFPGLNDGSDYLYHTKKLLGQSQMDYTYDRDVYTTTVGDEDFHAMELSIDAMGMKVTQEYMCTIKNDFALSFVISYSNEEEKAELYEMIDQIEM